MVPQLLSLILLCPLAAAALIWVFGRQRHNLAVGFSMLAAGIAMIAALFILFQIWNGETVSGISIEWLRLGGFQLSMGFLLNPISATMMAVVTFVGFWIHLFSVGYMKGDPGKGRFFGGLSIFMFSMLGIVLADNLFMAFVFWELVGFSSYMLIGHYLTDEASSAAKKAFIVNRVGDFGFLIGIIMVYWQFGTTNLVALEEASVPASTLVGLLLFCGVLGKSAQMPLHVWLPDAMAGPTPISALIHAATMVAAGVFLLARLFFLFSADALEVITWVGTITAFCAAIWAFAQRDIKKILAYSTLSQLGYMVAAFGLGTLYGMHHGHGEPALYGAGAAMFHLTTHAFFKALLFLGSGSVIHACHHEQDIFRMGGLFRKMPITGITFLVGVLAIAGIPGLAGFFSKDAILYLAQLQSPPVFGILAFTALLTATYMGRLFVVAFLGTPNSEHAEQADESPWTLWLPLVVLAVFAALGGTMLLYPESLQTVFDDHQYILHPEGKAQSTLLVVSTVASVVGLLGAFLFYGAGASEDRLEVKLRPAWAFSRSRFYFDEVYDWYVTQVQQRTADVLDFFDALFIGGVAVRGSAGFVGLFGLLGRAFHTGSLAAYVWWFFVGVALIWGYSTGLLAQLF